MIKEDKITELMNQYFKKIFMFSWQMTGDREESYDITQNVFIKACSHDEILREDFNTQAWLYRVARNLCLDHFRKIKRYFDFLKIYRVSEISEADIHIEGVSIELQENLSKLNKKYSEVLIMKYFCDLSCEEIAEITGFAVGTILSRLSRGRELLKGVIENGSGKNV